MTIAEEIAHLKEVIAQGDRLAEHGFPTQGMNELNKMFLKELEEANDENESN